MVKTKHKRKMINVTCKQCKQSFEKPLSEFNRSEELGRSHFCSRTCAGKYNVANVRNKSTYDISQHAGHKHDQYTPFRYHYRSIMSRYKVIDVTLDDLKNQWDAQNGVCPFTGIQLILSNYSKINTDPINSASLDRIDNAKGYIKGNIRWVSRAINFMKNSMSDDKVFDLFNIIHQHIENKKAQML